MVFVGWWVLWQRRIRKRSRAWMMSSRRCVVATARDSRRCWAPGSTRPTVSTAPRRPIPARRNTRGSWMRDNPAALLDGWFVDRECCGCNNSANHLSRNLTQSSETAKHLILTHLTDCSMAIITITSRHSCSCDKSSIFYNYLKNNSFAALWLSMKLWLCVLAELLHCCLGKMCTFVVELD